MIIGQFGEVFPPIKDGVAQVIKNYAYWLQKSDDECYVITADNEDAVDNYDFAVLRYKSHAIPAQSGYRNGIPKLDRKFCRKLNNINFDIVHSHSPFSAGKLGISTAKRLGIPSVITFHTKFKDTLMSIVKFEVIANIALKIIMRPFSKADDVWAVSESTAETLRQYGFKGDIFITENACDFYPEEACEEDMDRLNEKYDIPKDMPVLVFVGRMEALKRVDMILAALGIAHENGYDFRAIFVGHGDKMKEYIKYAEKNGFGKKVIFTGGIDCRDTLKHIYQRSSALLFPSTFDNSSLVMKEASAFGCPTIAVDGATTSYGITDEENGFLIKNDVESLALAVQKILDNPQLAHRVGIKAQQTLYRNWQTSVERAKERYIYIIDKKKRENNA